MPSADTISAERMKPVRRETIVPAAITALDFSSPAALPPFLAGAAGAAAGAGASATGAAAPYPAAWAGAGDGPGTPGGP
jgi:hypothetical protein